jgi:glycosyltransferase involved in cell wall biosynthesis
MHVGKVLIVAYHFPPLAASSGYLRSLKFCRYLPEFGWQPSVLTVSPRAYDQTNPSQLAEIPSSVGVRRAFGLNTQRHLSVHGRYLRLMALPDQWVSWCLGAIPAGLQLLRQEKCDVIFSTFPIPSAILIGWLLHRLTGKPWVVDLRDSMTEPDYPRDPRTWKACRWLERKAMHDAAHVVFTARSAVSMYLDRYPTVLSPDRCSLIPNGYDEEDFRGLVASPRILPAGHAPDRPLRLVHMGLLYPIERDPLPFFRALGRLQRQGLVDASRLRIELRASGYDFAPALRTEGIERLVHLLPALPYREALRDAANADGLLLFQAACCDHQIPAKVFEYLRLAKPILALTSHLGDTAALLKQTKGATVVDSASADAIAEALPEFLNAISYDSHPRPDPQKVQSFSRREQARALADLLSELARSHGPS